MSGPKLLDARTAPLPPCPLRSSLFLYSPVTYSAVGVFFNNERNVSPGRLEFVYDGETSSRDPAQKLMLRDVAIGIGVQCESENLEPDLSETDSLLHILPHF
jgi:hypothetical protein